MRWMILHIAGVLSVTAASVHAQTWEEYANRRIDMHERRAIELKASAAGMTVWEYLKAKNKRESPESMLRQTELRQMEQSLRSRKQMGELWEKQHALIEERHALVREKLERVHQRARSDAEGFLSKVNDMQDDHAVMLLAIQYPRFVSSDQANDAYKQALARIEVQGKSKMAGWSVEAKMAQLQIVGDAIREARESDDADRAKLFAELDEIKKDSDAEAQEERDFTYRNQVLDNPRQTAREIRDLRQQVQDSNNRLINEVNRAEWRLRNW